LESQLILALIEETYFRRSTETTQLVTHLAAQQPDNLLLTFLVISQNKKLHHTDRALAAFRARPTGPTYLPVPYLHHMAADLLLYQGQYAASERENLQFLQLYRGQHYRKSAAFKLYLAAWLGGKQTAADRYRQQIAAGGRTVVEEDTYAQRFYEDKTPLNPILTRARLQLDGGYYQEALTTLQTFTSTQRTTLRDQLEAPYRRARAYHGLGQLDSARRYYARTIALARSQAPYYFAPQAALQLGYLYQAVGQTQLARTYFQQALHYPKHEYKNSTDMKAKVALAELK
jgi:tetratricopeptide (TPR) repeat protein